MLSVADVYTKSFSQGLLPDPELTVSEWADQYRYLAQKASSEPGKWNTKRTPYMREIMDALSPSVPIHKVVFMKAVQIGATECLNNFVGYTIHQSPGPMMVIQPTVEMAKRWSRQRLTSMIEETPVLRGLVKEAREKDSGNTVLSKEFAGGLLIITGANSAVGLRSMPAGKIGLDEIDGYPYDVEGEGDPVGIAEKRASNFPNKKLFLTSTPTVKGFSRIELAYEQSDKRRYHVPCPFCGHFQVLVWSGIRWDKDLAGGPRLETIHYQCSGCGEKVLEHHKTSMLEQGKWIAEAPGPGKPAGFHLSGLYSPIGWVSWREIAEEFFDSKKDTQLFKTWINTRLGETWEEAGEKISDGFLFSRREDYGAHDVPAGGLVLTAGIDVQQDRIELQVLAWGKGEECWSVTYEIFWGDTAKEDVWNDLDLFLQSTFLHESGVKLKIAATGIDTGDQTKQVYSFVKPRQNRRIFAVKGSSLSGMPLVARPSKNNLAGVQLFPIGTDTAKDMIYGRLKIKDPGPGCMHFPVNYDEEYFRQLTAEKIVTKYVKGFPTRTYKLTRERNEALDTAVYATAALAILNPNFEMLAEQFKGQHAEESNAEAQKVGAPMPRRRGGFVNRWRK